ncbi:hypothetical protein RTCIAT899_PB01500 (plasmid) [Rhizobium tropici CIAT 899]|nr:hypothetical protein RTCIAT899_PB01500 [Rhizobium tropici CIAT 899]
MGAGMAMLTCKRLFDPVGRRKGGPYQIVQSDFVKEENNGSQKSERSDVPYSRQL